MVKAAHPMPIRAAAPGVVYSSMLRILLVAALLPWAAAADIPAIKPSQTYCTDGKGQPVELGGVICIRAGCQTWLARCDTSLNNVIWRKIQNGCPGVSLTPAPQTPAPRAPS